MWSESTRSVRFGRTTVLVVYPRLTDPRLIQIAVLIVFNVLGQVLFGFRISPIQILIVVTCAVVLDLTFTYLGRRTILLPASGLISGLSLALLLRVQDGPLSLWLYIFAAVVAICSKYLITVRGKHIFNPSNLAVTATLLLFGSFASVTPNQWQASWWLIALIVLAGVAVTARARVLTIVAGFYTFELLFFVGLPGTLGSFDLKLLLFSPALLIYTFYMITDPRTAPRSTRLRILYTAGVAALHWSFTQLGLGPLALFLALTVACCVVPLLEGGEAANAPGRAAGAVSAAPDTESASTSAA